jgi:hypothetical protein
MKLMSFIEDYLEDLLIVIGIIAVVAAMFILFSFAVGLLTFGVLAILMGVIDPHRQKKGR